MNESLTQPKARYQKWNREVEQHFQGHRLCLRWNQDSKSAGCSPSFPPSWISDPCPSLPGLPSSISRGLGPHVPPTHLSSWKQWAAVITQRSAMSAPPQMCRPRIWRLACQGHSPSEDTAPPTMRPEGPWRPQSGGAGGGGEHRDSQKPVRNGHRQTEKGRQEGQRKDEGMGENEGEAGPRAGVEERQKETT